LSTAFTNVAALTLEVQKVIFFLTIFNSNFKFSIKHPFCNISKYLDSIHRLMTTNTASDWSILRVIWASGWHRSQ